MKRISIFGALITLNLMIASVCNAQAPKGWTTLGEQKWLTKDGVTESIKGMAGFLVTEATYTDFKITLDFMNVDGDFSGVFIRCLDPKDVRAKTAYKIPINKDDAENPNFLTGAISGLAKPLVTMKTAGKWNKMEITAKGDHLTVKINDTLTADIHNSLSLSGPIALQTSGGITKFKNVVIKKL